jgi:hypothetical protein
MIKQMEERYTRHSTIITINLGYDEWQNFLGNKSMVDALLSRVRHYLPHRDHQRSLVARTAGLNSWSSATMCAGFWTPTV